MCRAGVGQSAAWLHLEEANQSLRAVHRVAATVVPRAGKDAYILSESPFGALMSNHTVHDIWFQF